MGISRERLRSATLWILLALVLVGGYLRFTGLNWDPEHTFHPDERNVLGPAVDLKAEDGFRPRFYAYGSLPIYLLRLTGEVPAAIGRLEERLGFVLAGPRAVEGSPHERAERLRHQLQTAPQEMGYLERDGARLVLHGRTLQERYRGTNYQMLKVLGRGISAFVSTISILLIFFIGRRLFDERVGLLAAAFVTFSVILVQSAHYATVEPMLTLWLLCALWASTRIAEKGTWQGYALFGLFAGLGFATKTSGASMLVMLGAAHLVRVIAKKRGREPEALGREERSRMWTSLVIAAGCLFLGGLAWTVDAGNKPLVSRGQMFGLPVAMWFVLVALGGAVVMVVLASRRGVWPWALVFAALVIAALVGFAGWPWASLGYSAPHGFRHQMNFEGGVVSGSGDVPYTQQYYGTVPYAYHIWQIIRWTVGVPLGVVLVAGFAFAVAQAARSGGRERWLWVGGWAIPFVPILIFRGVYAGEVPYKALPMGLMVVCLAVAALLWLGTLVRVRNCWESVRWLLLVSWAFPYFIIVGSWKAKFVRYTVPLIPVVCLMGAAMLVILWDRYRYRGVRAAVVAVTAASIAGAAFYSFAFLTIYVQPSSRFVASEWIYRYVPKGSRVLLEHWDDGLPVRIPSEVARVRGHPDWVDSNIRSLNLNYFNNRDDRLMVYERDVHRPNKVEYLCEALGGADYVVTASKRLYGSIMAVPERYPKTSLYYKLLFAGQLGYEHVATITSYPRLFGIEMVDDLADESFMNYDHPKVNIFKNVERLSAGELARRFAQPPLEVVNGWSMKRVVLARAGEDKQMARAEPLWPAPPPGSVMAAVKWFIAVEILGLLAVPVVFVLFHCLEDRGVVSMAKLAGLLLAAFPAWLMPSLRLAPFSRGLCFASVLALASVGGVLYWRHWAAMVQFVRRRWKTLVIGEAVFVFVFLFFLVCRAYTAEIYWGEKPMDFSFLNAITRGRFFPPAEPWMSGKTLNYFYYGHYLVSFLSKLTALPTYYTFNLAIGLFPALVGAVVFGLVHSMTRSKLWGVAGVVAVLFVASIAGLFELCWGRYRTLNFDYFWATSRVLPNRFNNMPIAGTINEYPLWTYLFADLHAHMMALPIFVALIAWGYNGVSGGARGLRRTLSGKLISVAFLGFLMGSLAATNLWDLPTAVFLLLLFYAAGAWRDQTEPDSVLAQTTLAELAPPPKWSRAVLLVRNLCVVLAAGAVALVIFLPFWRAYENASRVGVHWNSLTSLPPPLEIATRRSAWETLFRSGRVGQGIWKAITTVREPAPLADFLKIWGLPLFVSTWFFSLVAWRRTWGVARVWEHKERDLTKWDLRRKGGCGLGYGGAALVFALVALALTGVVALIVRSAWPRLEGVEMLSGPLRVVRLIVPDTLLQPSGTETRLAMMILFVVGAFVTLLGGLRVPEMCGSGLATLAIAIAAATETFTISDRMNTVFKYYFEMWPLLMIAMVVMGRAAAKDFAGGVRRASSTLVVSHPLAHVPWMAGTLVLVVLALFTSVTITRAYLKSHRVNDERYVKQVLPTLNGVAYMAVTQPAEYDAVQWLNTQVSGLPVILEAWKAGAAYQNYARISMNTGLPTVVGWEHHLSQRGQERREIERRVEDVGRLYQSTDPQEVERLLRRYGVSLVYVGWLERQTYSPEGLAKFEVMEDLFYPVFRNPGVSIWGVAGSDYTLGRSAVVREIELPPGIAPPAAVRESDPPGVLRQPRDVAVGPDGSIYVADFGNSRIQKFTSDLTVQMAWGGKGGAFGQFNEPCGVAVDSEGNVWVADTFNGRIQKFSDQGELVDIYQRGPDGTATGVWLSGYWGPRGIAVDSQGNVYFSDTGNHRILKVSSGGVVLQSWSRTREGERFGDRLGEFKEPVGIAVGPDGSVYVCDTKNRRIQRILPDGRSFEQWRMPNWDPERSSEAHIDVDQFNTVWVTDPPANRVVRFTPQGRQIAVYTTDTSGREFHDPKGIAVNNARGRVYVTNTGSGRISILALTPP